MERIWAAGDAADLLSIVFEARGLLNVRSVRYNVLYIQHTIFYRFVNQFFARRQNFCMYDQWP